MDLYYPKRSGSTKALLAFNFVAYTAFALGAIYLSHIIVRQAILTPPPEHLTILLFPTAFLAGLLYWGSGTLDLLTSHFRVSVSSGRLYFDYVGRSFSKRKEVILDQITDIAIAGHPQRGVWVSIRTKKRRHNLGHLLDPNDAARIIEMIRNEKSPSCATARPIGAPRHPPGLC